jgi:NADH dehydrogenase [ubiquinone] 1 alpha subcomplex assembly factor 6
MLSNLRAGKDVGHDFEHEGEEGHEYDTSALVGARGSETPLDEVNRAFGVFMPAIATRLWLERLQQYDFDVFRPELLSGDWRLPWKAYMAFRRKSIE